MWIIALREDKKEAAVVINVNDKKISAEGTIMEIL